MPRPVGEGVPVALMGVVPLEHLSIGSQPSSLSGSRSNGVDGREIRMIFVGDDWSEEGHDFHVMDEGGQRLASRRLSEGLEGVRGFHELVGEHVNDPSDVVVGIETDRGLWVHALTAAGYRVYAISPVSVSRYRDRHNLAGAKSDSGALVMRKCWRIWSAPTGTTTGLSPGTLPTWKG